MTESITTTLRRIDGEWMLDAQAMALMFGVDRWAIDALPLDNGQMRIPHEWVRRGKRRAKEATARTGSGFILDILRYWARQDHNADLKVVHE
jgi:hypothetical protein